MNIFFTTHDREPLHAKRPDIVHQRTRKLFSETVTAKLDNAPDHFETELAIRKFIEILRSGKMEIMDYPCGNIHAKGYISRFSEDVRNFGCIHHRFQQLFEARFLVIREFYTEADIDGASRAEISSDNGG